MFTTRRSAAYLALAQLSIVAFALIKGYLLDGTTGVDLLSVGATVGLLNAFPLLFGFYRGLNTKSPLHGALIAVVFWAGLMVSMAMSPGSSLNPLNLIVYAVFGTISVFLMVHSALRFISENTANDTTTDGRTKPLTFELADNEGRIRNTEVMVVPKQPDNTATIPFGKDHEEREVLLTEFNRLVTKIYESKKERFKATKHTAGEAELIEKKIDSEQNATLKRAKKLSNSTLRTITENFTDEADSLANLFILLNTTQYATDENVSLREASVFTSVSSGARYHALKPHLDNLRRCHPILAREDLSDLKGENLSFAKKLLALSLHYYEAEEPKKQRDWTRSPDEFQRERDSARATIRNHTPYMTPALADAVLFHPDKLELVQKTLTERSIPVHQADTLINEIVSASVPLTDGAL